MMPRRRSSGGGALASPDRVRSHAARARRTGLTWGLRWALLPAAPALLAGRPAAAQARADAYQGMRVAEVVVRLEPQPADSTAARALERSVRRQFGVFPGRLYDPSVLDFGLSRVRRVSGVTGADVRIEFADGQGLRLVVTAATGAPRPRTGLAQQVRLVDDGARLLKLIVRMNAATQLSGNQWFDNGATLTRFNPRGIFTGGRGPNGSADLAPRVGLAGALPVHEGNTAVYLYGSASYLAGATVGQDNNRNDARIASGWEEGMVGLVGGSVSPNGHAWRFNVAYGMQPYCIGNGMLLCQLGSSGGDRAADFAWPRWNAKHFLKAQFRFDDAVVDLFGMEPNDFPSSRTRLRGMNVDIDRGYGLAVGGTWLRAGGGSTFPYVFPDGTQRTRAGTRAWQLRGAWTPRAGTAGPIARAEFAQQTNANFPMRADGLSLEGGWSAGRSRWTPALTYRYSRTTGDDPTTARFERWDLLYSGDDVDTWVQGQLMKNIQYNSNVVLHRVLLTAVPSPQWKLSLAGSRFFAEQPHNFGGVIAQLDGRSLGTEALFVAERFVSRNVYVRYTTAGLWPGQGVRGAVPGPARKPWLVGIAQVSLNY